MCIWRKSCWYNKTIPTILAGDRIYIIIFGCVHIYDDYRCNSGFRFAHIIPNQCRRRFRLFLAGTPRYTQGMRVFWQFRTYSKRVLVGLVITPITTFTIPIYSIATSFRGEQTRSIAPQYCWHFPWQVLTLDAWIPCNPVVPCNDNDHPKRQFTLRPEPDNVSYR